MAEGGFPSLANVAHILSKLATNFTNLREQS